MTSDIHLLWWNSEITDAVNILMLQHSSHCERKGNAWLELIRRPNREKIYVARFHQLIVWYLLRICNCSGLEKSLLITICHWFCFDKNNTGKTLPDCLERHEVWLTIERKCHSWLNHSVFLFLKNGTWSVKIRYSKAIASRPSNNCWVQIQFKCTW